MKILASLMLAAAVSAALPAQTIYVPVNAPYAQKLVVATKNAHPELQKLGLHAIPPGQMAYAIIASPFPSKIGKESSDSDLTALSGNPFAQFDEKGKFYDIRMPLADASGYPIGISVYEIPFGDATNLNDALAKATAIRDEIQKKIPNRDQLFQATDAPAVVMPPMTFDASIKGHFDHVTVDEKHNRLFATAEDSHAVVVFDLVNGTVIKQIDGLIRPHAILYRADLNRFYVTDGGAGELKIFDGKTYEQIGSVKLEKDADSIGYDDSTKYLYIDNGGKDAGGQPYSFVSVVDTTTGTKLADIRVDSDGLEAMALDIFRPRMYVNNHAQNEVTVIDRLQRKVIASWPLTMGKLNVAMGLDEQRQRLFVGCRSGVIVVLDSNTGKELQALPIAKGVDDVQFDPASKRLYAIGDGTVDVFQEVDADHYTSLGSIPVGAGAKTGRLVASMNRYFAAVPASGSAAASIAILQPMNLPLVKPVVAEIREPVTAPHALELDLETMSAHPDLRKMGIHAIPPGEKDSAIIANANVARIGYLSSKGDLEAVKDGSTYCVKKDDGAFFNAKLPLKDASGKVIGILVMEIPFSSAPTEEQAIHEAENIRQELSQKIPDYQSLFAN